MINVLQIASSKDIKQKMQAIGVDSYGIDIMLPKAIAYLLGINSISNIAANILKQEMLSLGGDVAVARGALTGKVKKTACLIMGNLSQFNRLAEKLARQPFGLDILASSVVKALNNFQKVNFTLDLNGHRLDLHKRTHIMGVVNLTPDSFSQDGFYSSAFGLRMPSKKDIIALVERKIKDGADIIDVGGESSRPGAKPVSVKEELNRTIPVIKELVKRIKVPVSIDTSKPLVARQALDKGAVIVNDITGLRNPEMASVVAKFKAGVVIMHMQGMPRTMQKNPRYLSLVDEIIESLDRSIKVAFDAGIHKDRIIVDPGIGFGKTCEHNLEILKRLAEFKVLGMPILVGPSRKSFIGKILHREPHERIFGTLAACILAVNNGAKIVRVHDVKEIKQALKLQNAINNA